MKWNNKIREERTSIWQSIKPQLGSGLSNLFDSLVKRLRLCQDQRTFWNVKLQNSLSCKEQKTFNKSKWLSADSRQSVYLQRELTWHRNLSPAGVLTSSSQSLDFGGLFLNRWVFRKVVNLYRSKREVKDHQNDVHKVNSVYSYNPSICLIKFMGGTLGELDLSPAG